MSGVTKKTGLIGPVAFCAALFLIVLSPVFRGGNRHVAMVVLETLALFFLFSIFIKAVLQPYTATSPKSLTNARRVSGHFTHPLMWALVFSPVALAAIYLLPVPSSWWLSTPGRAVYAQTLDLVGLNVPEFLPLSLNPVATWTSLLAVIPAIAAFVLGQSARLSQLRTLAKVLVACAFFQVTIGVLQLAAGPESVLYFDGGYHDSAIGSFANRSHYANYIGMIFSLYLWLGFTSISNAAVPTRFEQQRNDGKHAAGRKILWTLGGALLLFGVLISRSRGAALTGLPMGLLALVVLAILHGVRLHWRVLAGVALVCVAIVGVLFGFDFVSARYLGGSLSESASFRTLLASSSLDGAWQFWPWGAGWGTYEAVYPRFQPEAVAGYAEYAHHDYIQMLFEGGIFAAVLLAVWFWLFAKKASQLVLFSRKKSPLDEESLMSVASGFALIGVMLHALVEFSLHIPANAILAALLAGIYLRPMRDRVPRGVKE